MYLSTATETSGGSPLPTVDELDHITLGCHVRLGLESGARFWCQIQERRPTGYVGRVVAHFHDSPVRTGDQCFFDRGNVFEIFPLYLWLTHPPSDLTELGKPEAAATLCLGLNLFYEFKNQTRGKSNGTRRI